MSRTRTQARYRKRNQDKVKVWCGNSKQRIRDGTAKAIGPRHPDRKDLLNYGDVGNKSACDIILDGKMVASQKCDSESLFLDNEFLKKYGFKKCGE